MLLFIFDIFHNIFFPPMTWATKALHPPAPAPLSNLLWPISQKVYHHWSRTILWWSLSAPTYCIHQGWRQRLLGAHPRQQHICAEGIKRIWRLNQFVIAYLRRRVQQTCHFMLHYCRIPWNIPGQHWHPQVHGLWRRTHVTNHKPATLKQGKHCVTVRDKSFWDLWDASPSRSLLLSPLASVAKVTLGVS